MQIMTASKSAKRQPTRMERIPHGCAQHWWQQPADTDPIPHPQSITAAVAGGDTVMLKESSMGERPRNETVLVVDDEPLMREFMAEILRDTGYEVLEASGAMEAQQLIQANRNINLLLTDFSMPGTNGLELARWFQSKYPRIKVLITTGALWDLANQVGEQEGMAILLKPFDVVQLSRMVRLTLDEARGKPVNRA